MANTDVLVHADLPEDDTGSTSVHRAIDCLATVGIEVQLLRRKIQRGESISPIDLDDALMRIEPQLDGISVILAELRDRPQP